MDTNLPTLSSILESVGFVARAKRQRYDKSLLEAATTNDIGILFADTPSLNTKIEVLGQFNGYVGWGEPTICDAIVVTLPNGTRVPCYRKNSPDNSYAICQVYSFKAILAL